MRAIIPIAAADEAVIDLIPSALFNKVHNLAEAHLCKFIHSITDKILSNRQAFCQFRLSFQLQNCTDGY